MSATVGTLLAERAATHADATFLRFAGAELTFAEVEAKSNGVARGLRDLGVDAGDTVAMLLPNCADMVLTWFAANRLGAVAAPINTAFRGAALAHVLNLSGAGLLVVDASLVESVAAVAGDLRSIRTAVVRGDPAAAASHFPQWTVLPLEGMETHESGALPTRGWAGRSGVRAVHLGHHGTVQGLCAVSPLRHPSGRTDGGALRASLR